MPRPSMRKGYIDQLDPEDVIPPGITLTLMGLVVVHRRFGRATVREVAVASGRSSAAISTVHAHLRWLRERGFCTWDDGTSGTLRPLVHAFTPSGTNTRAVPSRADHDHDGGGTR